MSLLAIAWRSLAQHRLSTAVTVLSVALGSGLVMAVFGIAQQTEEAFIGGPVGFDAVIGTRGSKLQLVMNTVFHLETSSGNLSWETYRAIAEDKRVARAVPYALGDNYLGYRIVGTTLELFDTELAGTAIKDRVAGRVFDPQRREAVIGYTVAHRTGLRVGGVFRPYHGLDFEPKTAHQHATEYVVVGVMRPTNSPWDRAIWIPIEGLWRMEGHEVVSDDGKAYTPEAGQPIPDEYKEVSAVMVDVHGPASGFELAHGLNRRTRDKTMVYPIQHTISELFQRIGWVVKVLQLVAYLVVVVAAAGILAAITNTIHERRREFAILRALGASRLEVFSVVLLEALTIATLGALAGFAVYVGIMATAGAVVLEQTGVVLDLWSYHAALAWTPAVMIAIGGLAGLLPARAAYRTDVAGHLVAS